MTPYNGDINRVNPEGEATMNTAKNDYIQQLKTKIWITRGARFNAYRRLNRRSKITTYLISIYSAYVLIASFFEEQLNAYFPEAPSTFKIILFSSSLLILVLSVIENASRYEITAYNLHENAKKLSPLIEKLELLISTHPNNEDAIKIANEISREYYNLINSCAENHSSTDHEKFKLDHPETSPKKNKLIVLGSYYFSSITFILTIFAPFFLIFLLNRV